jgi:hypothetical protein
MLLKTKFLWFFASLQLCVKLQRSKVAKKKALREKTN